MALDPRPSTDRQSADDLRRRRKRSLAIALALGALAVLFYAITIAKLGPQVLSRAI